MSKLNGFEQSSLVLIRSQRATIVRLWLAVALLAIFSAILIVLSYQMAMTI